MATTALANGSSTNTEGTTNSALGGRMGSLSLSRQISIYSLTLDEFQNAMGEPGKNFGSMNMDELLKNIWTAEESQAMAALFNEQQQPLVREPSIQRQNSLTLPKTLSKKTVDEVWRDVCQPVSPVSGNQLEQRPPKARQPTYGEMTLEDFLVKAGVMRDDEPSSTTCNKIQQPASQPASTTATTLPQFPAPFANGNGVTRMMMADHHVKHPGVILGGMTGLIPGKKEPDTEGLAIGIGNKSNPPTLGLLGGMDHYNNVTSAAYIAAKEHADWIDSQYKNSTALAQQQHLLQEAYLNGVGNNTGIHGLIGGGAVREGSPNSPLSDRSFGNFSVDGPLRGRKRILDAPFEKVVERRQRRMIKNRESAARSRARKQAYTVELEAEVTQLKEENMRLRKMQEEESEKRKRAEIIGPMTRHLPKMLRRTLTGPW